jgi:flavin-dependent dehydrogenase
MIETADAVIIGGGIMGASTAYFLMKRGAGKVVLLEKYPLRPALLGIRQLMFASTIPTKSPFGLPNAQWKCSKPLTRN